MNLKAFIKRSGWRLVDISRATGLHSSIILRVRDQQNNPSVHTLLALNRWADSLVTGGQFKLTWSHLYHMRRKSAKTNGK